MILEIKDMGFELDFSSAKFRNPFGDAVCRVLNFLCDTVRATQRWVAACADTSSQSLQAKGFRFGVPVYEAADETEDAEVDEEAQVAVDVADEVGEHEEEEENFYADMVASKGEGSADDEVHDPLNEYVQHL